MTDSEKQEFEARLFAKTPEKWYGLAVPEQWYEILDRLDKDLEKISPGYRLLQAKSKFGGLRYYIEHPVSTPNDVREKAEQRIREAEAEVEGLENEIRQ